MNLTTDISDYRMQIEKLNKVSFPPNQRRDLDYYIKDKGQNSDVIAILEQKQFVGFAVVLFTEDIAHLIYFAIEPSQQGEGLGSQTLQKLIDHYDMPLLADVEDNEVDNENQAERNARIKFYKRNGFRKSEVEYEWRDEDYVILSTEPNFTPTQYETFWDTIIKQNPELSSGS